MRLLAKYLLLRENLPLPHTESDPTPISARRPQSARVVVATSQITLLPRSLQLKNASRSQRARVKRHCSHAVQLLP